jgi:DNA-binding beta-propeller fold protein YncE
MCDGSVGFPGQACRTVVGPCTFGATSLLDGPGGEDDLLDCLRCRVEETGLALARLVQGANLCCTETGCDTVMTRRSCQRAGGRPAYYQIDDAGVPGFNLPHGIAFAPDGTMYVADQDAGQTITVSTVPPGGARSVLATLPVIGVPSGIALDQSLNAYVPVPCGRNIVYKVTPAGDVSVFAGTLDTAGNAGDGGPATDALLAAPRKAATDNAGNVYLTQSGLLTLGCPSGGVASDAEHVRMVDAAGTIHTVAGSGPYGSAGEGEAALSAQLGGLTAMLVTPDGSMLLGEAGTQRLLRIDPLPPAGILTRIAGRSTNPFGAYAGDGGPARLARFYSIEGIVQDAAGNVIVADFQNNRIRLVDRAGSIITIAGNGVTSANPGPGSGDGGPGELAFVGCPQELVLAPDGRIWFHNQLGARYFRTLRRVSF